MPDGAAPDEHFGDLTHFDGGLNPCMNVEFFECILQGKRVHHGSQHSHVIGGNAIKALSAGGQSAKNITTADDDGDFDAEFMNLANLAGDALYDLRIDAEALVPHQSFAAELEQNPPVFGSVL
jgi:hypothetical protein